MESPSILWVQCRRLPPVSLTLLTSHPSRDKGIEWSPPFLEDESFIISENQQKRLVQELAFTAFHGGNAANFSNILYFHTSKILSFQHVLNMKSGEILHLFLVLSLCNPVCVFTYPSLPPCQPPTPTHCTGCGRRVYLPPQTEPSSLFPELHPSTG